MPVKAGEAEVHADEVGEETVGWGESARYLPPAWR